MNNNVLEERKEINGSYTESTKFRDLHGIITLPNRHGNIEQFKKNDTIEYIDRIYKDRTGHNYKNRPIINPIKEASVMDNNDLLLKLIDKVEESNKQLKNDVVESEKRNATDRKEREERIVEQQKLSEARIENKFNEAMDAIKHQNENINRLSDKVDKKVDSISNKLDSTNKWIIGLCLTTIIGIAAMVVSVFLGK